MQTKKTLLAIIIQLSLSTMALAGDVEIHLPAASDALTVDQPAGTELIRVHGDGNVGIGTAELNTGIFGSGTHLGQQILHNDGTAVLSLESYRDSGNHSKVWATANRGTQASPLPLNAGDFILELNASAFDGTNFDNAARIALGVDDNGTVTPGSSMPGKIVFRTSPDGATGDAERMRIDRAGNIGIGTTDPSDGTLNGGQALKLDIEGAVGASHYCDENGENCQTAANLGVDDSLPACTDGQTISYNTTSSAWECADISAAAESCVLSKFENTITGGATQTSVSQTEAITLTEPGQLILSGYMAGLINDTGIILSVDSVVVARDIDKQYNDQTNLRIGNSASAVVSLDAGEHTIVLTALGSSPAGSDYESRLSGIVIAENCDAADNLGNHTASQDINLAANKLVGNGGTEGIAIDAGGNVGVGTAVPVFPLDIAGNTRIEGSLFLKNPAGPADNQRWWLRNSEADGSLMLQALMDMGNGGGGGNTVKFTRSGNNVGQSQFLRLGNPFAVFDHNSQRLGIGTETPTEALHVVGNILATGTVTPSDERLKKEIKPVENALSKVKQLQGVTYKWKDPDSLKADTDTQLGLIAQEVEKVVPEVVETTNDARKTKGVSYANLVALLIEGMKEQQVQIEVHQAQLAGQQQRIEALEAKLQQ